MAATPNSLARNLRPRLLHSWGASIFSITQKTYHQAEKVDGPFGAIIKATASLIIPILHPVQTQLLLILSFVDDQILLAEDLAMKVFPPSSFLFSIFDQLALLAESIPQKFDDVTNKWSYSNEIMLDIECNEEAEKKIVELDAGDQYRSSKKIEEVEETSNEISKKVEKVGMVNEKEEERSSDGVREEVNKQEVIMVKDTIMELFDEGWGGNYKKERVNLNGS